MKYQSTVYLQSLYSNKLTLCTRHIATTQMQPTDARKAFPCMDEPAIKATFDITLVRPEHLISLSNMPIKDSLENWFVHVIHVKTMYLIGSVYAKVVLRLYFFVCVLFNKNKVLKKKDTQ